MRHWPERVLFVLLLAGTFAPFYVAPAEWYPVWPFALIPVGWLLAFAVWAGIIAVVVRLDPASAGPGADADPRPPTGDQAS
jgi:hypothetical protein